MVAFSISCCHLGNIQSMAWGCAHNFLPKNYSKLTVKHTYSYASSIGGEKNMSHLKISAAMDDNTSSISCSTTNNERPLANFHSSVWGDYFLSYTPQLTEISSQERVELEELKEKVRQMLIKTPDNSIQKLELIDTIQRLGVAYHFKNEIQTSIKNIFDASQQSENKDDNLCVVALRFRLMRQQRHYMSSDVFKKFTNKDGKFKETLTQDVQGLLSLYEAAHLRVHGEEILEQALSFTVTHLESMGSKLSNSLLKAQVSAALSQPIHTNLPRMTARKYISIYENIESHNNLDLLLKFAKLDFNIVQKVHQRELGELTRCWNDLVEQFSYARDRLVECHFYTVGIYFEPQYSRARELMTKVLAIYTIIDDTYDAFATYDELVPFTDAIATYGCDISAMDSIPPSLRPTYQALVDLDTQIEEKLSREGTLDRLYYAKIEMKKVARAYFKEAEWLNAGYIPKCDEYMKNANISTTSMMGATISLALMEEPITKETFEWMINEPLILQASSAINRLKGDCIGHNLERQRKHIASFIECYMKEFGGSKQDAYAEAQKKITNAWEDMNKDFLCSTHDEVPTFVLELVINIARVAYIFEENDFASAQGEFKDKINLLFVEPVNV
uniref:(E,E)-germacrene B synthase-like n=1 Tax=Nicotiana tabacum TaxID=4097 RepID=A0A1S3XCC6_TOBAC|nr:PREDICTED: (E,E)-germacrene B synthase-like [Nicotiana tabacum]